MRRIRTVSAPSAERLDADEKSTLDIVEGVNINGLGVGGAAR